MIVVAACYPIETRWMRRTRGVERVRTPVGERAADALDLRHRSASLLLSTGFCGGVRADLRTGDLVLAECVIHGDEIIHVDPVLLNLARVTLEKSGCAVFVGPVVSLPTVADRGAKGRLDEQGVLSVDMESGPMAGWASAHGAGFISLRAVLDEADVDVPFSPGASLLRSVLSHPLAALRAGRWAGKAGRRLGRALDALALAMGEES